jgi:hypothetical protein
MAHFLLLSNFECLSRDLATNSSISGTSERLKATEKSSRLIPILVNVLLTLEFTTANLLIGASRWVLESNYITSGRRKAIDAR